MIKKNARFNLEIFVKWKKGLNFRKKSIIMRTILFIKENFVEGGADLMTSYELIWRLIVLLLLSNNNNENQEKSKE